MLYANLYQNWNLNFGGIVVLRGTAFRSNKAFAVLKGVNENQVRAKIIEWVVVKFTLNSFLKTNQTL